MAEVHVKRALPSLIGGIFSAVVAFALWLLLFGTASVPLIALGAVVAAAGGGLTRPPDLLPNRHPKITPARAFG
jgi:hypothetical protein